MERFTTKDYTLVVPELNNFIDQKSQTAYINERMSLALQKLGLLEDIDDYFGLIMPDILNCLLEGFVIKYEDGTFGFVKGGELYLEFCFETKAIRLKATGDKYYFKDYGKTWALAKWMLEEK